MKQLCPKCNGQKKVSIPPEIPGDIQSFRWGTTGPYDCQVCEGTGMVETKFPPQPQQKEDEQWCKGYEVGFKKGQQKEQFSREDVIGFAEWIVREQQECYYINGACMWDSWDNQLHKPAGITTDQLLTEYLNSKNKIRNADLGDTLR